MSSVKQVQIIGKNYFLNLAYNNISDERKAVADRGLKVPGKPLVPLHERHPRHAHLSQVVQPAPQR